MRKQIPESWDDMDNDEEETKCETHVKKSEESDMSSSKKKPESFRRLTKQNEGIKTEKLESDSTLERQTRQCKPLYQEWLTGAESRYAKGNSGTVSMRSTNVRPDKTVSTARRMIVNSLGLPTSAARLTESEREYEQVIRNKLQREKEARKLAQERDLQIQRDIWER